MTTTRPTREASRRKTPRLVAVSHESEKGFQAAIVQYAELRGWRIFHDFLSVRNAPGLPDLILCRPPQQPGEAGRLIFMEVKRAEGHLRPEQRAWLTDLATCPGVEAYVFYPADWPEVERILA